MRDGEYEADEAEGKRTFIEQARRRQIVEVAVDTLAASGFGGTTFARIAERAGISPSLISYHFSSKNELINQIVADIMASMDDAIVVEIQDAASYGEALRGLIETQVRYFADHRNEVLALGHISASGDADIIERLARDRSRTLEELEEMFREGQDAGELRSFPTRPMAVTLLAALEAVPGELLAGTDVDVDAYGQAVADIFVAAVSPRS